MLEYRYKMSQEKRITITKHIFAWGPVRGHLDHQDLGHRQCVGVAGDICCIRIIFSSDSLLLRISMCMYFLNLFRFLVYIFDRNGVENHKIKEDLPLKLSLITYVFCSILRHLIFNLRCTYNQCQVSAMLFLVSFLLDLEDSGNNFV